MAYQYIPLLEDEIRVLKLLPNRGDGVLRSVMHNVSFHAQCVQRYTALSYCWETDLRDRDLVVDNKVLKITQPLTIALHHIHDSEYALQWLWIDQICINQDESDADMKKEKNRQVDMMSSIYTKTSQLIIWLGEGNAESRLAIEKVEDACRDLEGQDWMKAINQRERVKMTDSSGSLNIDAWIAVLRLLKRKWFNRRWVVQEVCLPKMKDIIVICGYDHVPWWHLSFVHIAMFSFGWYLRAETFVQEGGPEGLAKWKEMCTIYDIDLPVDLQRRSLDIGLDVSMLDHLWNNRHYACGNERDRIFSLLGLCRSEERREYEVNYAMSVKDVFIKGAWNIIKRTQSINILAACLPIKRGYGLPSWVPDWTNCYFDRPIRLLTPMDVGARNLIWEPFWGYEASLELKIDAQNHILVVTGHIEQIVQRVSPNRAEIHLGPATHPTVAFQLTKSFWELASQIENRPSEHKARDDGGERRARRKDSLHTAFFRTLIVNRDSTGQPVASPPAVLDSAFWPAFARLDPAFSHAFAQLGSGFWSAFAQSVSGRKFFVTKDGDMGLGPYEIEEGDLICLIPGASVPFVLRERVENHEDLGGRHRGYTFIGECYCHALMNDVDVRTLNEIQTLEIW